MAKPIIYLAGFENTHSSATLLERAIELQALVIDVRFQAWSSAPDWQKPNLQDSRKFGLRYVHLPQWGNRPPAPWNEIFQFDEGREILRRIHNRRPGQMRRKGLPPFINWILLARGRGPNQSTLGPLDKRLREEFGFTVRPLVWRPEVGVVSIEEREFSLL